MITPTTPRHKAYCLWNSLRHKCYNPKYHSYRYYGERGISVCRRWREFNLYYLDMGDAPEGMTLDRIDNDGDYSPSNCRWATPAQQQRNKRSNRLIVFDGRTQCVADWADETGINSGTIRQRIDYLGWSVSEALTR